MPREKDHMKRHRPPRVIHAGAAAEKEMPVPHAHTHTHTHTHILTGNERCEEARGQSFYVPSLTTSDDHRERERERERERKRGREKALRQLHARTF